MKGGKTARVPSTETEIQTVKRLASGWMIGGKEMNTSLENNGFKMSVSHPNTQTVKVKRGQSCPKRTHRKPPR